MTTARTLPWILAGYDLFAKAGPEGLKIEVLARRVGKSKSSFYHHFADLEGFTEALLWYHVERAKIISAQEKRCQNVVPELVTLLMEIKQDLLFSRQLRVNRQVPAFKACFEQANKVVAGAMLGIWASMLGLADDAPLANRVLSLTLENFYLQLTEETLRYEWLVQYVQEVQTTVRGLHRRQ